jgi:hypothetical protein
MSETSTFQQFHKQITRYAAVILTTSERSTIVAAKIKTDIMPVHFFGREQSIGMNIGVKYEYRKLLQIINFS